MANIVRNNLLASFLALALVTCSAHEPWTPPPLPQAPPGWSPIAGQGTQPCSDFDFPTSNPVGYCYNGSLKPKLGQVITMTFTITGSAQLIPADTSDISPATLHLFLWRNGDDLSCVGQMQQYRWWGTGTNLQPGTYTVAAKLDPANWTDCYGQNGAIAPALFEATLNNLRGVGFTFGGQYFFGHGVRAVGSAHFHLDSFTIATTLKRRHRRK